MPNSGDAIELIERAGGVEFAVKVVPGASRTRIVGRWGEALKVAVAAPPEGGKANSALVALLAKTFGVGRGAVTIVAGQSQPRKRVSVSGLTAGAVRERLG